MWWHLSSLARYTKTLCQRYMKEGNRGQKCCFSGLWEWTTDAAGLQWEAWGCPVVWLLFPLHLHVYYCIPVSLLSQRRKQSQIDNNTWSLKEWQECGTFSFLGRQETGLSRKPSLFFWYPLLGAGSELRNPAPRTVWTSYRDKWTWSALDQGPYGPTGTPVLNCSHKAGGETG